MRQTPRVDVCVVERNSSRTLGRCLSAIRKHLPYEHLIVLDGGSSDESVNIAKLYTSKVFTDRGLLGAVRYRAATLAANEWVVFVDSDVYLYPTWWETVRDLLKYEDVGWVTGLVDYPSQLPVLKEYYDFLFRTYGATAFSNTAVRRKLILSCKELLTVHAGEDWVAKKHVMDLGFRALTVSKKLCYHDKEHFKGQFGAYRRWGQSYRLKHGPRGALAVGYLSFVRYPFVYWLRFTRTRRLSLTLLFILMLLGLSGIIGILLGMRARSIKGTGGKTH